MLLNSRELFTYDVSAEDGQVGRVRALLVDDETWKVRHIVVDTNGLLSAHEVLVAPKDVTDVTHPEDIVKVSSTKSKIEGGALASSAPPVSAQHAEPISAEISQDTHLRSARTIGGYSVEASDAPLGYVHGLIIDTDNWAVRYLVVDTGEMLDAKYVLVVPSAVATIDWETKLIKIAMSLDAVRHCPEYDNEGELSRQYEGFLHDYYGWPPYWV